MSIKQIITVAAGLSLAAGAYGVGMAQHTAPATTNTPYGNTLHIQPCLVEDGRNCAWIADQVGNGEGVSFIDYNGVAYYADTK